MLLDYFFISVASFAPVAYFWNFNEVGYDGRETVEQDTKNTVSQHQEKTKHWFCNCNNAKTTTNTAEIPRGLVLDFSDIPSFGAAVI